MIEKLQKIIKEKETQMKAGGGNKIVKKDRSKRSIEKSRERRCVEYLIIGYEVATTFIIIFEMCRRKSVQ